MSPVLKAKEHNAQYIKAQGYMQPPSAGNYRAICCCYLLNRPLCKACLCISTAGDFDARAVSVSFGMPASSTCGYDSDNPKGRNTQCLLQHKMSPRGCLLYF